MLAEVAAENAEPLLYPRPVKVGLRVIAGVVVGLATVPERPFAETTETLLTVPPVRQGCQRSTVPLLARQSPFTNGDGSMEKIAPEVARYCAIWMGRISTVMPAWSESMRS